jgi:hypothetical protein
VTTTLKFHKLAELFPLLEGSDQETLKQDVKENGQQEPIVLCQGEILDGRNRYLACQTLGIEPKTEEYTGSDPLKYMLSKNLHRRHLTDTQRSMIAAKIANLSHGGDRVSEQARNSTLAPVSQAQAAEALKVSVDSVKKARKIEGEAPPAIVKAVKDGKMSLNAATKTIPEKQKKGTPARRMMEAAKGSTQKIGRMSDDLIEQYEARLASIKAYLDEMALITENVEQISEELRHSLTVELFGLQTHIGTIANMMRREASKRKRLI